MTPLAHIFAAESTLPLKARTLDDPDGILKHIDGIHCFELTEVVDVIVMLFDGVKKAIAERPGDRTERLIFLPAPKTWLEWRTKEGGRKGWLLEDRGDGYADAWHVNRNKTFYGVHSAVIPLLGHPELPQMDDYPILFTRDDESTDDQANAMLEIYAALAAVNSPRVLGRRQHMPHAGLQRKLARAKGMAGRYPLHAWTEIKLDVAPPRMDRSATGQPHETRLTGAKALHFCRCHLRFRLGQLELVSAHYRGDPSLGIKQTRYRLTNDHPELAA